MDVTTLSIAQRFTKDYVQEQIKKLPQSGANDYTKLENKPKINGVELNGDLTLEALGIPTGGNTSGGQWRDLLPYGELGEDLSLIEYTNLKATKILIYGIVRVNDADDTLTTGNKRIAAFVNGNDYITLLSAYVRNSGNGFYFRMLIDCESGVLIASNQVSGDRVSVPMYAENTGKPWFVNEINHLKFVSTIDGSQYLIKANSKIGVKMYEKA